MKNFNLDNYQITDNFKLKNQPTKTKDFYKDKADYELKLNELQKQMDELQSIMYAHAKYGVLVIFQAMDAAGKDGTIKAVFKVFHAGHEFLFVQKTFGNWVKPRLHVAMLQRITRKRQNANLQSLLLWRSFGCKSSYWNY